MIRSLPLVVLFLFSLCALAQDPIVIQSGMEAIDLAGKGEFLVDETGGLSIDAISQKKDGWQKLPSNTLNQGYSKSVIWIRFKVDQKHIAGNNTWMLEVGYPTLDSVSLFYCLDENARVPYWVQSESGEDYPFEKREIRHRNFIYHLAAITNITITYYVRVHSQSSIQVPLAVITQAKLTEKISNENYLFGIYFGIIFIMMFYNLFLYFSIKDKSYLYYVLFISSTGLFHLSVYGLHHQYLFPGTGWWESHSILFYAYGIAIFICQFARSFLNSAVNAPFFDKIFRLLGLVGTAGFIVSAFGPYQIMSKSVTFIILLSFISALITGIICLKKGFRPARYFMLAWLGILSGGVIYALKQFGILPNNYFTEYGVLFGSITLVVLLSFALADRINTLKQEKEEIREKTMGLLEFKVEERTAEVVLQKQIIEAKNKSITDSIQYARRIQEGLLPTSKYIEKTLKRLRDEK